MKLLLIALATSMLMAFNVVSPEFRLYEIRYKEKLELVTKPFEFPADIMKIPRRVGKHSMIKGVYEPRAIYSEGYGYLSQQAWIYTPEGWLSKARKGCVIYFHGAGQRGSTIGSVDNEGLPEELLNGMDLDLMAISPQMGPSPTVSFWDMAAVTASIDHAINEYGVDPNLIYLTGYSLGATAVREYITTIAPSRLAAVHLLAGDYQTHITTARADSAAKLPILFSNSGGDNTQNISNMVAFLDSLLNPNHTLKYLPETDVMFGTSHGGVDEITYGDFDTRIARWLMLHHRSQDSTAEFHMDSLERAGVNADWHIYTRTEYIINQMASSSHKTNLLARLADVKDDMNGGSDYRRVVLDLGQSGTTSSGNINNMTNGNTGQVLSNMIDEDGAATTIDFNVVTRTNTTEEDDAGEKRGYFNLDANAFDDVFSVFNAPNSGVWRVEGLNGAKTYTLRMTGGGDTYSAGTQYGVKIIINGVTKSIPVQYRNTSRFIEFKGLVPSSGNITIEPEGWTTNSVGGIGIIEIIEEGSSSPISANAGSDTVYAYNQSNNTPPFQLIGSASGGTPSSWSWTQVSGPNTASITNATNDTATVSSTTKGWYTFRLTVDGADQDDVNIYIRDYNEAGSWPAREGGGQVFHVGHELMGSYVTTTYIDLQYINRDLPFSELVLGGDTIMIHVNPNNGGVWNTINMGYFGGTWGAPVVVMPADTNVVVYGEGGYWRLGAATTADTNFVNHVKLDGMAHRDSNAHVYGFHAYRSTGNGNALVANLVRNLEVCGFSTDGAPFIMKMSSDSAKPWTLYDNYRIGKLWMHDLHIWNSTFEAMYIGHTAPDGIAGGQEVFNDGPTPRGADSTIFERIIIDSCTWDGIQLSNYGNMVIIRNNVAFRTGTANQSSHQAAIFIGGYTQGEIYGNVAANNTGGLSCLGKGISRIRFNILDSIRGGTGSDDIDAVYNSQAIVSVPPALPDSLTMFTTNNLFGRIERNAVFHANTSGRMRKGAIRLNTVIDADVSGLFDTNANDTVENNTYMTTGDLDTFALADSLPAWQVYRLIRQRPEGYKTSFFDIELQGGGGGIDNPNFGGRKAHGRRKGRIKRRA